MRTQWDHMHQGHTLRGARSCSVRTVCSSSVSPAILVARSDLGSALRAALVFLSRALFSATRGCMLSASFAPLTSDVPREDSAGPVTRHPVGPERPTGSFHTRPSLVPFLLLNKSSCLISYDQGCPELTQNVGRKKFLDRSIPVTVLGALPLSKPRCEDHFLSPGFCFIHLLTT